MSISSLELATGVAVGALELLVGAGDECVGDGDAGHGHEGDHELHLSDVTASAEGGKSERTNTWLSKRKGAKFSKLR